VKKQSDIGAFLMKRNSHGKFVNVNIL